MRIHHAAMCPGTRRVRYGTARCCSWRSCWRPLLLLLGRVAVFVVLLELTMCTGHSVGFHRRLIHRTFKCPKWMERMLVWSGTLVGMQGPFWVIQSHDFRDWAQRQPTCHPYLRARPGHAERRVAGICIAGCGCISRPDSIRARASATIAFYRFLQRTWMLQQVPVAVILYADRRHALAGLGRVRARRHRRVDALVRRLYLSLARSAELARRQRRSTGAQRAVGRDSFDGRELAQQSPRVSRFGASRAVSRARSTSAFSSCSCWNASGLAWDIQTPETLPPREGITAAATKPAGRLLPQVAEPIARNRNKRCANCK